MSCMTKSRMAVRRRGLWNLVEERTIEKRLKRNLMRFVLRKFGVLERLFEVFDLKPNKKHLLSECKSQSFCLGTLSSRYLFIQLDRTPLFSLIFSIFRISWLLLILMRNSRDGHLKHILVLLISLIRRVNLPMGL